MTSFRGRDVWRQLLVVLAAALTWTCVDDHAPVTRTPATASGRVTATPTDLLLPPNQLGSCHVSWAATHTDQAQLWWTEDAREPRMLTTGVAGSLELEVGPNHRYELVLYAATGERPEDRRALLDTVVVMTSVAVDANRPPVLQGPPSGPTAALTFAPATYEARASDSDGDAVEVGFDFDGDEEIDAWSAAVSSGESATVTHVFTAAGSYWLRARARDPHGATSDFSAPLRVTVTSEGNRAPEKPSTPNGPGQLDLFSAGSYGCSAVDPDGDDVALGFDFNQDGVAEAWASPVPSGGAASIEQSYANAGTFGVRCWARDVNGAVGPASDELLVSVGAGNARPHTPAAPVVPSLVTSGALAQLSASAEDPDGDEVSFGFDVDDDANVDLWSAPVASGTAAFVSHVFGVAGTFMVRARARDAGGLLSEFSAPAQVMVQSAPPPGAAPLAASFVSTQAWQLVSEPYTFGTRAIDPNGDEVVLAFDFDGDDVEDASSPPLASNAYGSVSHSYAQPGTYVVRARARDAGGLVGPWSPDKRVTVGTVAAPALGEASGLITATPNVIFLPADRGSGKVTLAWATHGSATAQVWVSVDGQPEALVASATSRVQVVPWIARNRHYRFSLYAASTHHPEDRGVRLADTVVTALRGDGPGVGLNKYDLTLGYLGRASGGDGSAASRPLRTAMARKAIREAAAVGATYLRVSLSGWFPHTAGADNDLALWQSDPADYWSLVDQMFDDAQAAGVRIIPSLVWHVYQFPSLVGETLTHFIADSGSASRQLAARYVREAVQRYATHPALYFWELGNEYALKADLDMEARLPGRTSSGNFTSDQLFAYYADLTALIRGLDARHLISSGDAAPRSYAAHLRASPEFSTAGPDWAADSQLELESYLHDACASVDLVSIHLYNGDTNHERFGITGTYEAGLIEVFADAAQRVGRPLYFAEFNDQVPPPMVDDQSIYTLDAMQHIAARHVPFSSPWAWQFYQFDPSTPNELNIEMGYTDTLIGGVAAANAAMGNPPWTAPSPDVTPPTVILTTPTAGVAWSPTQRFHCIAGDDSRAVASVEFWLDGAVIHTATSPPFETTVSGLASGAHAIVVRAFDGAGNVAEEQMNGDCP